MIYYTSDLHLGHANVIRHCNRPFAEVTEMDKEFIENWNRIVHRNDTIYIVGDLIFRAKCLPEEYLSVLKGRKHLVIGNHDKSWMKKVDLDKWFETVSPMLFITDNGIPVTLCHYPMMTWPGISRGGYMVYGHIHNNTNADYWQLIAARDHMLNAGVDINAFSPVSLETMINNNALFKKDHETDGSRPVIA